MNQNEEMHEKAIPMEGEMNTDEMIRSVSCAIYNFFAESCEDREDSEEKPEVVVQLGDEKIVVTREKNGKMRAKRRKANARKKCQLKEKAAIAQKNAQKRKADDKKHGTKKAATSSDKQVQKSRRANELAKRASKLK